MNTRASRWQHTPQMDVWSTTVKQQDHVSQVRIIRRWDDLYDVMTDWGDSYVGADSLETALMAAESIIAWHV